MRVQVARDVIGRIRSGFLTPAVGAYVDDNYSAEDCQACALGAMFCVLVADAEAREVSTLETAHEQLKIIRPLLLDHFSSEQLGLVECAFEGCSGYYEGELTEEMPDDLSMALDYFSDYPDEAERLVAIMQSIIDNEGTFVP